MEKTSELFDNDDLIHLFSIGFHLFLLDRCYFLFSVSFFVKVVTRSGRRCPGGAGAAGEVGRGETWGSPEGQTSLKYSNQQTV